MVLGFNPNRSEGSLTLSRAYHRDFRICTDHINVPGFLVALADLEQHSVIDPVERDANVARYWNRKRGIYYDSVEEILAKRRAEREHRMRVRAEEKRLAKMRERVEAKVKREAAGPPPIGDVSAGDPVKHRTSGRTFVVIEDQGDEVVVKGINSPRLTFLKSSLCKP